MVTEQMSISRDVALNFHAITDNILFLNDINKNRALFWLIKANRISSFGTQNGHQTRAGTQMMCWEKGLHTPQTHVVSCRMVRKETLASAWSCSESQANTNSASLTDDGLLFRCSAAASQASWFYPWVVRLLIVCINQLQPWTPITTTVSADGTAVSESFSQNLAWELRVRLNVACAWLNCTSASIFQGRCI